MPAAPTTSAASTRSTRASTACRATILGRRTEVVSEHHQGVRRLGRGVRVTSLSSDGIVEMVEVPSKRFVLGLQWHPERTDVAEAGGRIADALVSAARTSPTRLAA